MSQREFACLIGASYRQAYKYEQGQNRVSVGLLYLIAEILDAPVDYFFQGIPPGAALAPRNLLVETTTHFAAIPKRSHQASFSALVRALAEHQS